MQNSLLLLSIAGLMIGIAQVIRKRVTHSGHDSKTYTSVIMLMNAVFSIPLLFHDFYLPSSLLTWLLVGLSIVIFAFSTYFGFQAYKKTDISIVAIIQQTSIICIALLGIVFLKEQYSLFSYLGLGLILLSSLVLSYEGKRPTINAGIVFALLMAFTGSVSAILDKIILKDFSPYTYVFINNLLVGLVFAFNLDRVKEAKTLLKTHLPAILTTSVLGAGSFLLLSIVLQRTDVSKTMPVYKSLGLITPVLIGILVLGEKGKVPQKILSAVLAIVGILLIYGR